MERAQNLEAELIQQARRANIRTAYTKFQIYTTGVLNMDEADDETSLLDKTATFEEK